MGGSRASLQRLEPLMVNDEADSRDYGLDGSMEVARIDRNNDGAIDYDDGDRVYLYFGMRRGGYHYYAVDVTTRTSPKLMWRIGRADVNERLGRKHAGELDSRLRRRCGDARRGGGLRCRLRLGRDRAERRRKRYDRH